ncbi:MAG: FAD-dependent monooxygenase, partial [Bacteroidetes bacterium]|nr:FAD-dependent monooxygenase [Bacteroidota bacterium]
MLLKDKKIAIIGGGPGGLTLARLLQLKGAEVKVYERDIDRTTRLQGGALDLHTDSGLAALDKAGLLDAFKANYRPGAEKIRVVDNQGKIHFDQHTGAENSDFGDPWHRPEIDRGPLRDILLDSLQPGTVVWNSRIVSLEASGDAWKIVFASGDTVVADILIGADGSGSRIRPFVTDVKPVWAGVVMIEGALYDSAATAPHIQELLKGGKIFAFGNEKTVIVSSKGDGNFGFSVSFKAGESWVRESGLDFKDNRQLSAWFGKEFAEWGPLWQELFTSDTTLFIPRPQYCMPLDQFWEARSNI